MKTFDGNHEMNGITATSSVIPFAFEAKSVRVQGIAGAPWFCATDVCSILGYSNSRDALSKHCREAGVAKRDISSAGQKRSLTFISEGNLYRLIIKSRKEEAQRFESWVCDEVLPAIRKHGRYEDRQASMMPLVAEIIGVSGANLLNGVIAQKIAPLPVAVKRKAKHKLHSILHTRFNVPRTDLIPAEQLDAACLYIANYVFEGEFMPRSEVSRGTFQVPLPASMAHRLLVSLGPQGQPRVSEIPMDACVMSITQFIDHLGEPNEAYGTQVQMLDFTITVMQQLRRRMIA